MSQEVKNLKVKDLVLWTENPRDPIKSTAKDQHIVDKALSDTSSNSKWSLAKLAKEMGDYYDFSELPTVVFEDKKPIVYDGNRRMILAKLKHGFVTVNGQEDIIIPDIPLEIPCNVCSRDIALKNILRKHGDSGSWHPLERDIFLNKFMKEPKSPFLVIEENTGLITARPYLNQRFVKDEIFREENLTDLGFEIKGNKLHSVFNDSQAKAILGDIAKKIEDKKITTRTNRGKVLEILDKRNRLLIDKNKGTQTAVTTVRFEREDTTKPKKQKLSPRKTKKQQELFGGIVYLVKGDVNDLHRDISDLYTYYCDNKAVLSASFPAIVRMALRLLCETAAKDKSLELASYIKKNFAEGKKNLDQNAKTTLSTQNVNETSLIQLLHIGAHQYHTASNLDQTIAVSIIVAEMLKITHGQKD